MRTPVYSTQFKKDYKLAQKRGKDILELRLIMSDLTEGKILPPERKDHALVGNHKGYRECHIEPDWLLMYKLRGDNIIFQRTGTHSDLFE